MTFVSRFVIDWCLFEAREFMVIPSCFTKFIKFFYILVCITPATIIFLYIFCKRKLKSEVKISDEITEITFYISLNTIFLILDFLVNFCIHIAPSFLISYKSL
jgi:hypothetical protein